MAVGYDGISQTYPYSIVDERLAGFQFRIIVNCAAMNILVLVYRGHMHAFLQGKCLRRVAGLKGMYTFHFRS